MSTATFSPALGGSLGTFTLARDPDTGATTEYVEWEYHKRGRNWAAKIAKSATAPGGLARDFVRLARGHDAFYIGDDFEVGAPYEFGGDYYSSRGRQYRSRSYAACLEKTDEQLVFDQFETPAQAIAGAKAFAAAAAPEAAEPVKTSRSATAAEVEATRAAVGT